MKIPETITEEEKDYMRRSFKHIERYYITPIRYKNQNGRCNRCNKKEKIEALELHHDKWSWDMTIDDYELLCFDCHMAESEIQRGI